MEHNIISSWEQNSQAWIETIEQQHIASRNLATNEAIISAIVGHQPRRVLDMGCGEGWLCQKLHSLGMDTLGIDAAGKLVERAIQRTGMSTFLHHSYEALVSGSFHPDAPFDLIVFNYSLFGEAATPAILQKVQEWLTPQGKVLIQTLDPEHPAFKDLGRAQWVKEDWAGMQVAFEVPMDWYYRTMADWESMFAALGYDLQNTAFIRHPEQKTPISVIFTLQKAE